MLAKSAAPPRPGGQTLWQRVCRHWQLYVLILPALLYIIIFHYLPIYGIIIAFEDFKPYSGYLGSPFVGLKHFIRFFNSNQIGTIIPNTILISLYSLVIGFPFPILLALCLNYVPSLRFKKLVQNVTYAPHFISSVVLVSMLSVFLGQSEGLVNNLRAVLGMDRILFLGEAPMFRSIYVWSGIWQGTGWSSIIYFAALSSVDYSQHEAAIIDGASILQRVRYVDIPTILPTIVTLFIMETGKMMNVGFEKAFLMQNDLNISRSELIATYVYKIGLLNQQYSYSTAINLFNSVVNLILIFTVNAISKKLTETSIW